MPMACREPCLKEAPIDNLELNLSKIKFIDLMQVSHFYNSFYNSFLATMFNISFSQKNQYQSIFSSIQIQFHVTIFTITDLTQLLIISLMNH